MQHQLKRICVIQSYNVVMMMGHTFSFILTCSLKATNASMATCFIYHGTLSILLVWYPSVGACYYFRFYITIHITSVRVGITRFWDRVSSARRFIVAISFTILMIWILFQISVQTTRGASNIAIRPAPSISNQILINFSLISLGSFKSIENIRKFIN